MLDYTNKWMSEIIKSVKASNGKTDFDITTVLDVEKTAGNISEKEIWPGEASRIRIYTNYDYEKQTMRLPNSAYDGPILSLKKLNNTPFEITVKPYPVMSKWRFEYSPNLANIQAFNAIYAGEKTVTLPLDLLYRPEPEEGEENEEVSPEYCWIRVVPAISQSISHSPEFRFYFDPTIPSEDEDEEQDDSRPPLLKWNFDNSNLPLIDEIAGKSLANYKNRQSLDADLIATRIKTGFNNFCLGSVYQASERSCIIVNDIIYAKSADYDQPSADKAKYCWREITNQKTSVYTELSAVAANDIGYDQNGNTVGTISEAFTTDGNYYECDSGINIGDTTKDHTLAFYFTYPAGGATGMNCGFRDFMQIYKSYYTISLFITSDTKVRIDLRNPFGLKEMLDSTGGNNGWRHLALTRTREYDITDSNYAYTPENKRGFVIKYGVYVKNVGYPYVRDPSKDENGLYAFTWTSGGLKDNNTSPTLNDNPLPTIWLNTSSPSETTTGYIDAQQTDSVDVSKLNPYYAEYRDEINIPLKCLNTDDPGCVANWYGTKYSGNISDANGNNCSVFKNGASKVVFGYIYENGTLINILAKKYGSSWAPTATDGDKLKLKLNATTFTSEQVFDGIDDLCIYDRFLSTSELKQLREQFSYESSDKDKKPKLDVAYNAMTSGLRKILVGDAWYFSDPDLTYYSPTNEDDIAAKFGWRKLSGEGPAEIWTSNDNDNVTRNEACIMERGMPPLADCRISDIQNIQKSEMPFKCDLVPYIIDSKTVAIVINTHNETVRMARRLFSGIDAVAYNSENDYIGGYGYAYTVNCIIWRTHEYFQKEISDRADNEENWLVDGQGVTLRSRSFMAPYNFKTSAVQWRNCQPGDKYYSAKPNIVPNDGRSPEIMQIAYLTLDTPMEEGSTHTLEWCGNTCQFTYGPSFGCSTIKINQEGYLPWANTKRAYLGRWLGTAGTGIDSYMPGADNRTFYIVPANNPDIEHAVLSGTMVQRCTAAQDAQSGNPARICSDRYGQGGNKERPMTGENVFELDFSKLSSAIKDAIVVDGKTYFRDEVEDYITGKIKINETIYSRDFEHDTCNAYAWSNTAAEISTVYTDTHIPDISEKARRGYDDFSELSDIAEVSSYNMIGWTTERILESDYGESETVQTKENPSVGSAAYVDEEQIGTISRILRNKETRDISGPYHIYIPGIGWSYKFLIHPQAFFHMYYIAQRGLFHQRSGCDHVKHPYTNWEYVHAAHEIPYEGNFCPHASLANNTETVYQVDPETLEPMLSPDGSRIQLSQAGSAFAQNTDNNKYDTQPMYGVVGGWFDAADFDMREYHIPIVRQLAEAYIRFPDNFSDNQCDLPESGDGIPDILSEAMWGARLWMTSQDPDGGIHGWFETHAHESDWPWESKMKYYQCCTSMRHSATYAAAAGALAKALQIAASRTSDDVKRERILEYARVYTDSACAAFSYATKEFYDTYNLLPEDQRGPTSYFKSQGRVWALHEWCSVFNTDNDATSGLKNPFGIDVFNAACALYFLTKENRYKQFITEDVVNSYIRTFGDSFALNTTDHVAWELAFDLHDEFPELSEKVRAKYVSYADEWIGYQNKHPYRWFWLNPGHKYVMNCLWGSAHPDCRAGGLVAAWLATGNEKYRDALISAFDYVYGCNNLGRSWVAGSGTVFHVKHLDSWLPRHLRQDDLWTSRPGISMYYMGHNEQPDYKIRKGFVGLQFDGRSDQQCPPIDCNAFPAMVKQSIGGTAFDTWYFKRTPYTSAAHLHGTEDLHVAAFEYTVWETISRKAMMIGMLMGKHNKPKFWYKQIAPKKTLQAEIRNFSFLP